MSSPARASLNRSRSPSRALCLRCVRRGSECQGQKPPPRPLLPPPGLIRRRRRPDEESATVVTSEDPRAMSASSLLEQVQAQPACLGHCVRRDGGRLGRGPPLLAGPRRRLSRVGIRASGRPRPEPPRLARSSRSSPAAPRSLPLAARASLPRFLLLPLCRCSAARRPSALPRLPLTTRPPRPFPFFPAQALLSFVFPFPFSSRTTCCSATAPSPSET